MIPCLLGCWKKCFGEGCRKNSTKTGQRTLPLGVIWPACKVQVVGLYLCEPESRSSVTKLPVMGFGAQWCPWWIACAASCPLLYSMINFNRIKCVTSENDFPASLLRSCSHPLPYRSRDSAGVLFSNNNSSLVLYVLCVFVLQ